MRENEKRESEKMLEIIHENRRKVWEKKMKRNKIKDIIQNVVIVLIIIVFIGACRYLTQDRKKAIQNCMKNHSQNYCERISG